MKTFSQLIEEMDWEPIHQKTISELIFDTPDFLVAKSAADNMWMPMSSGLFKRVMPDTVKATVFHVTGLEDQIDQLIKIQNSNKSISTFANMGAMRIRTGVEGGSGLVVEIEGNVLVSAREDIMSIPETSGRRMISFNWFRGPWGDRNVDKLEKQLIVLLKALIKKYAGAFGKPSKVTGDWEKWIDIRAAYVEDKVKNRSAGKVMQKIIKDYLDGIERIYKRNAKQVQKILTSYIGSRSTDDEWDEIVVDQFTIKKLYVIEDSNAITNYLPTGYKYEWGESVSNKYPSLDIEYINSMAMEQYITGYNREVTGRV
jgi:hypothetical protein